MDIDLFIMHSPIPYSEQKQIGYKRLYVKSSDGPYIYPGIADIAQAARDAGFQIWSWHYIYATEQAFRKSWGADAKTTFSHPFVDYVLSEANAVRASADLVGSKNIILDAEHEYYDKKLEASRTCDIVRFGTDVKLWLTSFAFPSFHPRFPWQEFYRGVDGFFPQLFPTYSGVWNTRPLFPAIVDSYMMQGLVGKPIYPCLEMFDQGGNPLNQKQWQDTIAELKDLPIISIFRYGYVGVDGERVIKSMTQQQPDWEKLQMQSQLAIGESIVKTLNPFGLIGNNCKDLMLAVGDNRRDDVKTLLAAVRTNITDLSHAIDIIEQVAKYWHWLEE